MGASLLFEHPNDEAMLAYLDGELSRARTRSIRNHLKSCWKCRFVLADLESQAQTISRLLSAKLDSDIHQSVKAKEKFLRWRALFEKRQKSFSENDDSYCRETGCALLLPNNGIPGLLNAVLRGSRFSSQILQLG